MGWINSFVRDRGVIAGGMCITAASVFFIARQLLETCRDDAEIKPVQPKTQYITQETEDSLKLSTLETLLGHYNTTIRDTAVRIICDRAVNDPAAIELLLYGITRPDYDERLKNLRALALITEPQTLLGLHTWKAYAALVRSLELSLDPNQEKLDDEHYDDYPLRDMTEKLCLMFLLQLVNRAGAEKLVKAKFVEKWLAKQNWGDNEEERRENFAKYMLVRNNRISDLVVSIRVIASGQEALRKAGLLAPSSDNEEDEDDEPLTTADRFNVLVTLAMDPNLEDDGNRVLARNLQTDFDEHRRRQLHREAMVLNDGTRPVNRDDIIQREPGSPS
ncbi:hypothetical protein QBC47DRAFT_301688 [Echria macrotheca]|uniref:Cytoskeleton-associated protein n=1 Tax=Echria macrotheca TaxID=438768 RepID=A0AAJ0F674_9PEZI|nr:hypothetical protein QBC47DRAFT_301688 [Echria macrotheca]